MGFPGDVLGGPGYRQDRHDRPAAPARSAARRFAWVPIRSLAPRHRSRILAHLLALDDHDRYLRFGQVTSDDRIRQYVESLDFDRDEVFGIFNRRLQLIAVAHLAYEPAPQRAGQPAMAEFGVSVSKEARGRGFGARLFERAVIHARNRKIDTLYIHALSENTAMLKIARKAGAIVERDGSEAQAYLRLPPDTLGTRVEQLFERQAAEVDYQLKRHAQRFAKLLEGIAEVRANVGTHRISGLE